MSSVRELLQDVDMELEDYTFEISKARNPSLTEEDRLSLILAGEVAWKRLEAAHRELERRAGSRSVVKYHAVNDIGSRPRDRTA